MQILVTGGAGFIGSNFLRMLVPAHPEHTFLNVDKLGYAANPHNLEDLDSLPNYSFHRADLCDLESGAMEVVHRFQPDWVVHFAAESHVDRSIADPYPFLKSNVVGTVNMLQACLNSWKGSRDGKCFLHISTDEVFGSLGANGAFTPDSPYDPSSPYSASKACSDHWVRAYHRTYGLPVKITNCSNNYGPRQFPEKLIPLMILNAVEGKPLPVYGRGENIRDWLYVEDHCRAIWDVLHRGKVGETYLVGGGTELTNLEVVELICKEVAAQTRRSAADMKSLITYVTDRPGHDFRYAIDSSKLRSELGWSPQETFESGLAKTVAWYLSNPNWVDNVKSGEYRQWVESHYGVKA